MKEFCSIGTTTDDQIQKDEKVVQIRNLFLKPRNKKRKNKSKMKKVWMPKVQVPIACERIEKVEVKHVQRISDSHLSSVKNVRSWKEKKREFCWFNEIYGNFCFPTKKRVLFSEDDRFSSNKWVCKKPTSKLNLKWVPKVP